MRKNNQNSGGFTLIEVLVVVLIIGILSSIALPQYQRAVEKARATEAMLWIENWVTAEEIYHMATGKFSADLNSLDISIPKDNNSMQYFDIIMPSSAGATSTNVSLRQKAKYGGNYIISGIIYMTAGQFTVSRMCATFTGKNKGLCKSIANGNACDSDIFVAMPEESSWCYLP